LSTTEPIPKKNTLRNYHHILPKFSSSFPDRDLESISSDEILSFLTQLTEGTKQATKSSQYAFLSAFFSLVKNTLDPKLTNPCDTVMLRKLFRPAKAPQWTILDKEVIGEIIFRTVKNRDRLILELMARGGLRVGEVLKLTPMVDEFEGVESITLHPPRKINLPLYETSFGLTTLLGFHIFQSKSSCIHCSTFPRRLTFGKNHPIYCLTHKDDLRVLYRINRIRPGRLTRLGLIFSACGCSLFHRNCEIECPDTLFAAFPGLAIFQVNCGCACLDSLKVPFFRAGSPGYIRACANSLMF